MSDLPQAIYYYPDKMGRIILLAMEETLGRNGLNAVLHQAELAHLINNYPPNSYNLGFPFAHVGRVQAALDDLYGLRGGSGLALRSGRACLKYGLREFGPLMGITDMAFRLLPLNEKLSAGAHIFADIFNTYSDQRVRVEEDAERFLWQIERCPVCWGRKTSRVVCHLAVGILQEALYWVSSGKYFHVEETACIARGDPACTILIEKKPLE
ncbi:MAG: 4-vinyl reductase [Chloroflexi bacterium]|nr:4-vinyl reductase [Chloroflexota bacterium]